MDGRAYLSQTLRYVCNDVLLADLGTGLGDYCCPYGFAVHLVWYAEGYCFANAITGKQSRIDFKRRDLLTTCDATSQ